MAGVLTGGCLCGAVRYEITAAPAFSGRCYCDDCRKTSGTGHNAALAVPTNGVSIKGKLTEYTKAGGSGQPITRRFCPTCGSRVAASAAVLEGLTLITASTLDDPDKFVPQMSVYCSHATSWDPPPANMPSFPGMPPQV